MRRVVSPAPLLPQAFYTGVSGNPISDDVLRSRVRFGVPPRFPEDDQVPYSRLLRSGYEAYEVFARKITSVLSQEDMMQLDYWKSETLRRVTQRLEVGEVCPVQFLAYYCWQVSLVHSMDHQAFFNYIVDLRSGSGARKAYPHKGVSVDPDAAKIESVLYEADDVRGHQNWMDVAGFYHSNSDSLAVSLISSERQVAPFCTVSICVHRWTTHHASHLKHPPAPAQAISNNNFLQGAADAEQVTYNIAVAELNNSLNKALNVSTRKLFQMLGGTQRKSSELAGLHIQLTPAAHRIFMCSSPNASDMPCVQEILNKDGRFNPELQTDNIASAILM